MRLVVIGGSDAGISAGLRARELDPSVEVSLLVADAYPNFSICGPPYYLSGDVPDWRDLAHRTSADLVRGWSCCLTTRLKRSTRRPSHCHQPAWRTAAGL
jgi:NADPH-dependent 2,4-dienoyl-CoA reductase/sulfur reductase-like enzyme